jgi:hypothetical protein
MVYSYVTHSKQGVYFNLIFENDMEQGNFLKVKFLPRDGFMVFSEFNIDLQSIKMRDPESIMNYLGEYGLTLILK